MAAKEICWTGGLCCKLSCICNTCSLSLQGFVELTIFPTVANLNRIKLNSKQCRIYRVRINDLEAAFIYNDPTLEVCHSESKQ